LRTALSVLSEGYVSGYLAESRFQHYVSLFEDYTLALIGHRLMANPQGIVRLDDDAGDDKLKKTAKFVPMSFIIGNPDRDRILRAVIERELDGLKYRQLTMASHTASFDSSVQAFFKGAMQALGTFREPLQWTRGRRRARLWEVLLQVIASYEVGNSRNRVEPRAIKRRPKPHKLLNEPRNEARNRLLKRKHEQPMLNAA
jgi:hypothetical protein